VTLRQLNRRCGPLSDATTAQIQTLPVNKLEALAVGAAFSAGVALLDVQGPADLTSWLAGTSRIARFAFCTACTEFRIAPGNSPGHKEPRPERAAQPPQP
jgi:hypothetical protein